MRRFVAFGPALVVLLTVAAVLFGVPATVRRIGFARTTAQVQQARLALDGEDVLERLNAAVRNIAASVEPSVVHIEAAPDSRERDAAASGSGWVYDDTGHIVTNAHVVRGFDNLQVQFYDGRRVSGVEVVGADPYTDIAVLKVPADAGVVPARRASGERPSQGDRVFAFGSPFGFKFSMSQGIVSGLGRNPQTASDVSGFTNFIQTDAAVNPGNSGGPLVDVRGRVIGMNVAIATGHDTQGTTEGQSAGISFAIPLQTIESVVEQLIDKGSVSRGYLGVSWGNLGDPVEYQPAIRRTGVRIANLTDDGPARASGLRVGDLITDINGQPVTDIEVLRSVITSLRPGTTVSVAAFRDGALRQIPVTLGEFPRDELSRGAVLTTLYRFGLVFDAASPDDAPEVSGVRPGSDAAQAGLKPGHLVLSVGQAPVETIQQAITAMEAQGLLVGRPVRLGVSLRDGNSSGAPESLVIVVR